MFIFVCDKKKTDVAVFYVSNLKRVLIPEAVKTKGYRFGAFFTSASYSGLLCEYQKEAGDYSILYYDVLSGAKRIVYAPGYVLNPFSDALSGTYGIRILETDNLGGILLGGITTFTFDSKYIYYRNGKSSRLLKHSELSDIKFALSKNGKCIVMFEGSTKKVKFTYFPIDDDGNIVWENVTEYSDITNTFNRIGTNNMELQYGRHQYKLLIAPSGEYVVYKTRDVIMFISFKTRQFKMRDMAFGDVKFVNEVDDDDLLLFNNNILFPNPFIELVSGQINEQF